MWYTDFVRNLKLVAETYNIGFDLFLLHCEDMTRNFIAENAMYCWEKEHRQEKLL